MALLPKAVMLRRWKDASERKVNMVLFDQFRDIFGIVLMIAQCACVSPSAQTSRDGQAAKHFRPIFITGFPRSGTTMVAAILDRHSALAISPETHFFEALALLEDQPTAWRSRNLLERLLDTPRIGDLALNPADVHWFMDGRSYTPRNVFQAILMAYQHRMGKLLVGEKTPCHLMEAPQLLSWFPESKMVFVLRDGRDAVASMLKMPWRGHGMARLHAVTWRQYIQFAQRMQRQFRDRFMFVKYEDILTYPEKAVRELDQFCGVQFEAAQVDASIPTHVIPAWEEPWKVLATRPLDRSRVGQWRTEFTRREKWAINHTMGPYLRQYGYSSDGMADCPRGRRLCLAATGLLLRTGETRRIYRRVFARFDSRMRDRPACQPDIIPQPTPAI